MATTSNLFMYSLTLKPSTAITQAVAGHFTGTKQQQVLTASQGRLTLYSVSKSGRCTEWLSHEVFGIIRQVSVFRLGGSHKDLAIISTDSGRVTVFEYMQETNEFHRIHMETFGKSGIRRVFPGEFMSCDAKGRAVMLSSLEKNKVVYILNRNENAQLIISSPLEAIRPSNLTLALTGLDVGWDNPVFASLEVDYGDSDQDPTDDAFNKIKKQLVYYELDLGLNHVLRKWTDVVQRSANLLIPVPGGNEGPSGVLVCSEEMITYHHNNQEPKRIVIPRRRHPTEDPDRKRYIISYGLLKTDVAGVDFFHLVQTDDGDLFRLTIPLVQDRKGNATGEVKELKLKYFGTIPRASSLILLRNGACLAISESGDHPTFVFYTLGGEDDKTTISSRDYPLGRPYEPAFFDLQELVHYPNTGADAEKDKERANASNLGYCETLGSSLHPQLKMNVTNMSINDTPQIYSVGGAGTQSSLKVIRHGVTASELVQTDLPNRPSAVWALKRRSDDPYDSLIVLSLPDSSLILEVGEEVTQTTDTGLLTTSPTIAVQQFGEDSLIQVYPRGVRHVLGDGKIIDWPAPAHRTIVAAATNQRQVAVGLSSGELVYFEQDEEGGLAEFDDRPDLNATITAMDIGIIPEGRLRSDFLAVGCDDMTIKLFSLEPDTCMERGATQAFSARPTSLKIMSMDDTVSGGEQLFLHIGLDSGVYIRTVMDPNGGALSDIRSRFIGLAPVKIFRITIEGRESLAAVSIRPWLVYNEATSMNIVVTPLLYRNVEHLHNFSAESCPKGVVGFSGDKLLIFDIPRITTPLRVESIPLKHTPRGLVQHPTLAQFLVIESDYNVLAESTKSQIQTNGSNGSNGNAASHHGLNPMQFGHAKGLGHWSSCIQIVDVEERDGEYKNQRIVDTVRLDGANFDANEAATAIAVHYFPAPEGSKDGTTCVIVATGKNMIPSTGQHSGGNLHAFYIDEETGRLVWLHKTEVEAPCRSLQAFRGKLLAGIGRTLFLFDLGARQLLRKAQGTVTNNMIINVQTMGTRVTVTDVRESVIYCVYKPKENAFYPFADDSIARWSTCHVMVDFETVAASDKFGNFFMVRSSKKASDEAEIAIGGSHAPASMLGGTENRTDLIAHFYLQDVPVAIQKTSLVPGGMDVLVWAGLQGTLGVIIPFKAREDVDFFTQLEAQMRKDDPPFAGRDHLAYRGYYVPPKGVIDGDLCERFMMLSNETKAKIAGEVGHGIRDIERKIGEMRTRHAY